MRFIQKILFTAVILSCFASVACKKSFLEVNPKGRVIAKTVNDYDLLLNSLSLVNLDAAAQIPMGDEVAAIQPYFSGAKLKTQRLFKWEATIYEPEEDAAETTAPLKALYTYNKIIQGVPGATDGTEAEKSQIRAEAMADRAWSYFLLINYFAKPYQQSTAATDPGFPIIKQADVTARHFTRASLQQVYDFILSDLKAAIPALPKTVTHRIRMSSAAGEAILGKVYLFMGDYQQALDHLDKAVAGLANSDIDLGLYDYNETFAPGGAFLPVGDFGPAYPYVPNIKEVVYGRQSYFTYSSNELVLNPDAQQLFAPEDYRLKFFNRTAFYGSAYPKGLIRRAGPSNVQLGIVVPDIYLMRAECNCRLGQLDKAVADVELLRKNRLPANQYKVPSSVQSDQRALLNFVLEERIREFALTGMRWFDMRRLSVDPLFQDKTYHHYLYGAEGNIIKSFELTAKRMVLKIPPKILQENPAMQDNP